MNEPWSVGGPEPGCLYGSEYIVWGASHGRMAIVGSVGGRDKEVAERIVACVNACACAGIPTSALLEASRVAKLVPEILCPKCGGLSWDVPLADYCRCDPNPRARTKKAVREILDG